MRTVNYVYDECCRLDLSRTKADFSVIMLGKAESYYGVCGENVSRDALAHLLIVLRREGAFDLFEDVLDIIEGQIDKGKPFSRNNDPTLPKTRQTPPRLATGRPRGRPRKPVNFKLRSSVL